MSLLSLKIEVKKNSSKEKYTEQFVRFLWFQLLEWYCKKKIVGI